MAYIQVQKNRSAAGKTMTYIYLAKSVWDRTKQRSSQQRVYIGLLNADGESVVLTKGMPGRSGSVAKLSELRRRAAAGEDLEAWLRTPVAVQPQVAAEPDNPSRVAIVGDTHALLAIASELGLQKILEQAFGVEEGQALLGLALHQAAEGSPIYLAADWLEDRELPEGLQGSIFQTDRIYAVVGHTGEDFAGQEEFMRLWIEASGKPTKLICDITSISSHSEQLELVEYGYNRDEENLPQVNLAIVCNAISGLPVSYRAIPGSIPDVSTLKTTSGFLKEYGLEDFDFSLDRGFYSQANVREMLEENIGFTMGVPFSVKQAKDLIRRHRNALASPKRSFPFNDRIMRHVSDTWRVNMGKGRPKEVEAHLFFEPARQAELTARLETIVFGLEDKAGKETFEFKRDAYEWLAENAKGLKWCFAVRQQSDKVFIERKPRAVALMAAKHGYTLVITDRKKRTGEDVLTEYRSRDKVEKLNDTLKNENGQHRLRTGNDASATGRLLVAFVALILHCELERRMREAGLLRKMSVAQFMAQTRKIKAVHMSSGKRYLLEVTKRGRELLAAVNLPLPQ